MEDSFLYFGYGSGLNASLVEFRVNEPVTLVGKGVLKNYAFKFNRLNPDGSARGNLCRQEQAETHGLLYQIHTHKFDQLAQTEPCYQLVELAVETEEGIKNAFAFICSKTTEDIYPQEKYLNTLIADAVANLFPEDYIESIRKQAKAR